MLSLCFLVSSFIFCNILIFFLLPILRLRFLDIPNCRSSHSLPTPRGGGLVFVFITIIASIISLFNSSQFLLSPSYFLLAPLFCLPLAIVGFIDDLFSLPSRLRFIVQSFTSLVVVFTSPLLNFSPSSVLLFCLALVLFVAVVNFVNFLDGLDGLVAGCMSVVITSSIYILDLSPPFWALSGSLLAFLAWNWSPAKVFMGDVGSTFLGAIFGFLVIHASSLSQSLALLLLATPLLADAFSCVVRRAIHGQQIFQPHRLHLFQRLHQAGFSHSIVSSVYILSTLILVITYLFGGLSLLVLASSIIILFGYALDNFVAVSFRSACD